MKKIFHSYIKKYQFFPKSAIYDNYAKQRISEFNRHDATLYLIVKTPKIKIVPSSFKVVDNFCIQGQFSINDELIDIVFNAAKVQFDDPNVKKHFKTLDKLTSYCMDQWSLPKSDTISNAEKYANATQIDLEKSSEHYIHINCALGYSLKGGNKGGEIILSPYQLISYFDMDCIHKLEILYIGRSNDDTWKRIYNHNKWGLIAEHHKPQDDLIVYFLELDKSFIKITQNNNTTLLHRDESELSIKDATKATESALITYFIRKKLFNIEHVGGDIKTTKVVCDVLRPAGYNKIAVELYLDGLFGMLGSESVKSSGYHKIEYEL